eukprot:171754-Chlamydomonas_euryale.AAC.2
MQSLAWRNTCAVLGAVQHACRPWRGPAPSCSPWSGRISSLAAGVARVQPLYGSSMAARCGRLSRVSVSGRKASVGGRPGRKVGPGEGRPGGRQAGGKAGR